MRLGRHSPKRGHEALCVIQIFKGAFGQENHDGLLREIEEGKTTIARQHKEWQDLYFQYLGRAVSEWAALEIVLDANIHVIMQHYNGKSIEPRIPMALNAKIKFLRGAVEKLKPLAAWREQLMADIDQIDGLSEDRHQLIHGSSLQYLGDVNGPLRGFMSIKMANLQPVFANGDSLKELLDQALFHIH